MRRGSLRRHEDYLRLWRRGRLRRRFELIQHLVHVLRLQLLLLLVKRVEFLLEFLVEFPSLLRFPLLILICYGVNDPLLALYLIPDLVYVRKRPRVERLDTGVHRLLQFLISHSFEFPLNSRSFCLYFR